MAAERKKKSGDALTLLELDGKKIVGSGWSEGRDRKDMVGRSSLIARENHEEDIYINLKAPWPSRCSECHSSGPEILSDCPWGTTTSSEK